MSLTKKEKCLWTTIKGYSIAIHWESFDVIGNTLKNIEKETDVGNE